MPPPWTNVARVRIIGEIHGQETVNVLHFADNRTLWDGTDALDTFMIALLDALMECIIENLLPGVTSDWTFNKLDGQRITGTLFDPVEKNAPPDTKGTAGPASASVLCSLVSLRCGVNGRRGRGRMYLPPSGESDTANSEIDETVTDAIVNLLTCMAGKFMGAAPSEAWQWVVLSRTDIKEGKAIGQSALSIVSASPRKEVAVLRSRRKRAA